MLAKITKCDRCGQSHVLIDGPCPLNKKIAEWVGFSIGPYPDPRIGENEQAWFDPNGNFLSGLNNFIDFLQSLDACYQYIEPKLRPKTIISETFKYKNKWKHSYCILSNIQSGGLWCAEDVNPALAFCLATEKLIDKDKV